MFQTFKNISSNKNSNVHMRGNIEQKEFEVYLILQN